MFSRWQTALIVLTLLAGSNALGSSVWDELDLTDNGLTVKQVTDLALSRAVELDLATSKAAQARYEANLGLAVFAPQLRFDTHYRRFSETGNPIPDQHMGAQATVIIPLSDYFLTSPSLYAAGRYQADAAASELAATQARVVLTAKLRFYDYVKALAAALVAADAIERLQTTINDITALIQVGKATEVELVQARSRLFEVQAQLAASESAVAIAQQRLTLMLKLEPPIALGAGLLSALPTEVIEPLDALQQAANQRPDMQAIQHQIRSLSARVRQSAGAYLPQLLATGQAQILSPNPRIDPNSSDSHPSWSLGLEIAWSPNDTVNTALKVSRARQALREARYQLHVLEDTVNQQIHQAANERNVALKSVAASTRQIEAAQQVLRVQEDLLQAGKTTASDVLDAQAELRRTQLANVEATIALLSAQAQLDFAVGGT